MSVMLASDILPMATAAAAAAAAAAAPAAPSPPSPNAHCLDGALLAAVLLHSQHHASECAAGKRPQKAVFGGGGRALQSLAQACEVLVGWDGHHGAAVMATLSYGGPLGVRAVVETG